MGAGQCCNQNPLNHTQKGEFSMEGQISRIFTEVTDEPIALFANSSPTQPFSMTLNIKNEDYLDQMYQLCKVEENDQFSQILSQQSQSNNQRNRQSRGSIISIQSKQKYFTSSIKSIHTEEPTQSITKHIATSNQSQFEFATRQMDLPNKTLTSDIINIAVSEKSIKPSQKNVVIQFQNDVHQSSKSISPERLSSYKKQSKKVRFTTVPLKKTIPQRSPIKNILKKKLNPELQNFEL